MKLARQLLEKDEDEEEGEEGEVVPEGCDELQSGDLSANGACQDDEDASREAGAGDSYQD